LKMAPTKCILTTWASGGQKQKGIVDYGISANRQNPFAGAGHDAVFNTFRRAKGQVFYWVPPMVIGYYLLSWATERYEDLLAVETWRQITDDLQQPLPQLQGWPR
jgi:hypothetical protein